MNLEELLRGTASSSSAAPTSSIRSRRPIPPLALFEWPGMGEPIFGSLFLATFGLPKTFVVMRARGGPNLAVAAFRGSAGEAIIPLCVS